MAHFGARPLVKVDWVVPLFVVRDSEGRTQWRFLDQLPLPSAARELLSEIDGKAKLAEGEAARLLAHGLSEEHGAMQMQRINHIVAKVHAARDSLVARYAASEDMVQAATVCKSTIAMGDHCSDEAKWRKVAMSRCARAAAKQLRYEYFSVIDGFLPPADAEQCAVWARKLHTSGKMTPGQVTRGERAVTRGDLMVWLPAEAEGQPACLQRLCSALDDMVAHLQADDVLLGEKEVGEGGGLSGLHGRPLVRREIQGTCYPGGGGTGYQRHIDDQAGRGARVLTAIVYLNPAWVHAHGGALRVYPKRSDGSMGLGGSDGSWRGVDVEPRHNRLVLFWSDRRVPHEVLPSHADRFAVSVWYGDADVLRALPQTSHALEEFSEAAQMRVERR